MTEPLLFSASIDLPDGRRITALIELPAGNPNGLDFGEAIEHGEVAQMAAAHAAGILHRSAQARMQVPF